jgi:glycosyltransferase involved in cell wall biosynthesis
MNRKIEILFLIRSMHVGGTERQLVALAKGLDKTKFEVHVALLYGEGALLGELEDVPNVKVFDLLKKGRWDLVEFSSRLIRFIRQNSFDIVYSFLPDVNLIASFAVFFGCHRQRLIWGIRASNLDWHRHGRLPRISCRLQKLLAGIPDVIISNSETGLRPIVQFNPLVRKPVVIPNGIDTQRFRPNAEARIEYRNRLNVAIHEHLIGMVARIDPMKDYETFIQAIGIIAREGKNLRFICIGSGPADYRAKLARIAIEKKIDKKIIWYGACLEMPSMYNALDIVCSASSHGEGFSNAVGEAMACGIPCVVTDVGDSKYIVGDTGVVVSPGDPEALAAGILELLRRKAENPGAPGEQVRQRIVDHFSVDHLVARTSTVFQDLCGKSIRS